MKLGLLLASVVVVLVALVLVLRGGPGSAAGPVPATAGEISAAPPPARPDSGLSRDPSQTERAPEASRAEPAAPAPEGRDAIPASKESALAQDPAERPLVEDLTTATEARIESAISPADREYYAKKYAERSAAQRTQAIEYLQGLIAAQEAGTLDKSQYLSREQLAAMNQEIAWLKENPGP